MMQSLVSANKGLVIRTLKNTNSKAVVVGATRPSAIRCNSSVAFTGKSNSHLFRATLVAAAAAAAAATKATALCEDNNDTTSNMEDSMTMAKDHLTIRPDDEFYHIPADYVPESYATMSNRIHPEVDHVLGPCDLSWKRFEMCIDTALGGPTVDYELAERKCLKYGLPLVDCFRKNHKGIMKRKEFGADKEGC